jgi:hypothetical protein
MGTIFLQFLFFFCVVMHEKMTISAQPYQIVKFVIFSILINMMGFQHSNIICTTKSTFLDNSISLQNRSINILSAFPVGMFWPDKLLISPYRLAWFTAKIFFTFRSFEFLRLSINFLTTNETFYQFSPLHSFVLARGRAIFTSAIFQPGRLCVKWIITCVTSYCWHTLILSSLVYEGKTKDCGYPQDDMTHLFITRRFLCYTRFVVR